MNVYLRGLVVLAALPALGQEAEKPDLRPIGLITSHLEEGPLGATRGVALDAQTGEVWVADSGRGRLAVFTADGVPLFSTTPSAGLREPTRLQVAPNGDLLVLDIDRSRVARLNYRGEPLGSLVLPGLPERPTIGAITLDRAGNLYVGENTGGRVHVFSPELKPILKFGSNGAEEGQFQAIAGIAVDDHAIYVVDHQVTPVQVFDRRGTFLRGWGRHDMGPANFSLPEAVALDSRGHVIVIDALRHEIKVFDKEGRFLGRFGGFGAKPGNVAFPSDVAVDAADRVYVAERGNGRVQVFEQVASRGGRP